MSENVFAEQSFSNGGGLPSAEGKPRLLDAVRGVIRCKRYGTRTEKSYVDWI